MISDEERRKVARRLRKLDHVVTNRDTIESGVNKFIKAVYGDRPYSPIECSTRNLCGLAMTLANLIDPQERTDEVPVGEIPGGYIIRKPRKPLFDAMSSQNAFDVLPKVDNIFKYISESVNYEVERKMFKSIAEAYGWKVMDE